jgi:hypothetical protein
VEIACGEDCEGEENEEERYECGVEDKEEFWIKGRAGLEDFGEKVWFRFRHGCVM